MPKVNGAWVETIDILPTIFDLLNLDPKVKMDGRSAFSPEVQRRRQLRVLLRGSFKEIHIPADDFSRERQEIVDRNLRLSGDGSEPPARFYRIGPHQELLGRRASSADLDRLDVDLVYASEYEKVDLKS